MKRIITFLPLLLAACVPASRPPAIAPAPARPVAAPVAAALALGPDWRDWPLTPGRWSYARGSGASFGEPGQAARLGFRCEGGRVVLTLPGASPAPATIRTSSTARALPVEGGAAALSPADPLLDAVAFSRGRFTVERPGLAPLVVPAHAEVARVVEDCRG